MVKQQEIMYEELMNRVEQESQVVKEEKKPKLVEKKKKRKAKVKVTLE